MLAIPRSVVRSWGASGHSAQHLQGWRSGDCAAAGLDRRTVISSPSLPSGEMAVSCFGRHCTREARAKVAIAPPLWHLERAPNRPTYGLGPCRGSSLRARPGTAGGNAPKAESRPCPMAIWMVAAGPPIACPVMGIIAYVSNERKISAFAASALLLSSLSLGGCATSTAGSSLMDARAEAPAPPKPTVYLPVEDLVEASERTDRRA